MILLKLSLQTSPFFIQRKSDGQHVVILTAFQKANTTRISPFVCTFCEFFLQFTVWRDVINGANFTEAPTWARWPVKITWRLTWGKNFAFSKIKNKKKKKTSQIKHTLKRSHLQAGNYHSSPPPPKKIGETNHDIAVAKIPYKNRLHTQTLRRKSKKMMVMIQVDWSAFYFHMETHMTRGKTLNCTIILLYFVLQNISDLTTITATEIFLGNTSPYMCTSIARYVHTCTCAWVTHISKYCWTFWSKKNSHPQICSH